MGALAVMSMTLREDRDLAALIRKHLNMSQQEFAAKVEIGGPHLSLICSRSRRASTRVAWRICQALDVAEIEFLFDQPAVAPDGCVSNTPQSASGTRSVA